MNDAVIVAMARTPIARARKGALATVDAFALAEVVVDAVIERSGIEPADVDDIVLGECLQGGGNIARHTAVRLGLPAVPGLAINRHCASGFASVQTASAAVLAGMCDVVVAGGTESLSTMPQFSRQVGRERIDGWVPPTHPATREAPNWDMSITVGENSARLGPVSRREADEWALRSHRNAVASIDAGWFAGEIVPVDVPGEGGEPVRFAVDEGPRRDTDLERLAALPPLHPELADPTVTAGNAGGVNDAAAALVIVSAAYARANGLEPVARLRSWSAVALPPAQTGLAPSIAIPKALARGGLVAGDIALYEINEAFCSVPVANLKHLGLDPAQVNVNGSGCSLGHPVAATGTRMIMTMIGELRRRGQPLGCVALCAGGGMGSACVVELLG